MVGVTERTPGSGCLLLAGEVERREVVHLACRGGQKPTREFEAVLPKIGG